MIFLRKLKKITRDAIKHFIPKGAYEYIRLVYKKYKLFTNLPQRNKQLKYFGKHKNSFVSDINKFEFKYYSQNGEDGIMDIIFYKIGVLNKYFVEFGSADGFECNTRYYREIKGWSGLWMDGGDHKDNFIKKEFITAENIEELFKKYNVPSEFDLLSIDIDFNDYWVWEAIKNYNPRVVVIEYNGSIPPSKSLTVKYEPTRSFDGTNYFGGSLLALKKLGDTKGYKLVACDNDGVNAIFIREDLFSTNDFMDRKIEDIYKKPNYGTNPDGGHARSSEKMVEV